MRNTKEIMKEFIVVLHNIRSLHNVGSIFRTADAVGCKKIYLCGVTPSPIDKFGKYIQQFSKVALGAERSVEWDASARSARAISKLLERLKKEGYKIFAVEQNKKSIPYYKMKPFGSAQGKNKNNLVLIFGNEVKGLPLSVLKSADKILEIPMHGKKESLNVSVAFGIVAFRLKYS